MRPVEGDADNSFSAICLTETATFVKLMTLQFCTNLVD